MIQTAMVAMVLMGCDSEVKQCEFIGETPARWESVAACESAMEKEILTAGNFNYPTVSGHCRAKAEAVAASVPPADAPAAAALPPAEPAAPPPQGAVPVSDDAAPPTRPVLGPVVEGGRIVFVKTADGYHAVRGWLGWAADSTAGLARRAGRAVAERLPAL